MLKYRSRKRRKLRLSGTGIPKISLKMRRRETQRLMALGVIFIFGLIMLLLFIRLMYGALFAIRINTKDVASMRIPPNEMTYIYQICREQQKDMSSTLTAYLIYNRFFREKQTAKTKEQLQMDFFPKIDSIKKRIPDKQFDKYYAIIETVLTEMKVFPIPVNSEYGEGSFMYGDTWSVKRDMCGTKNHAGCDIFDRDNMPGRLPVVSMTAGTVESCGKNGRGGMCIGIRTERGTYYFYDNLGRINESLEKGTPISPGMLIGYMGNGGKADKNDIKGNFQTNVHISIKVKTNLSPKEFQINPYPFLRYLEVLSNIEIVN